MAVNTPAGLTRVRGPVLGLAHLLQLRFNPIGHNAFLREAYGEVFRLNVFGVRIYVTAGADMAEQVLVNRERNFANGPAWSHFIGPFFHRGLMLLDFDEHLHHRRILQQAFTNEALRSYHSVMAPHIRTNLEEWESEDEPRLHHLFKALTLDLALETFVGVDLSREEQDGVNKAFVAAVRAGTSVIRKPIPGSPWAKGLKARAFLEDFFRSHLPAKRRDGGVDLFAQLCRARSEDGHEFSDDDIVNHMIFLLMAAHDTTTITLSSMAYHLATNPEWQERAREESMATGDVDYDGVLSLDVLDRVMKESMRLCSPVPSLPRVAVRDADIDGFHVPAGSFVTVSPYMNHYLPELWPDPTRFDPDRFAPDRREDRSHRLAFEPFGGGRAQVHRDALRRHPGPRDLPRAPAQLPLVGPGGLRLADRSHCTALSARRRPGDPGADPAMSVEILDAARRVFEQYGARRANVEDVARAAGVSRSTLYRAYPNKESLLEAVLLRQFDEFLLELDRVAADLEPNDAVVECFTHGLRLTREIPLLARLAQTEPDLITAAGAASHSALVLGSAERVAATLRRSGATMPEEDLQTVAELMLRLSWTYLLNPGGALDVTDEHAVRAYARRFLAPLVH